MMKLKVFEVSVNPCDGYATVTEAYENMSVVYHTMLRNITKHNYPFVFVQQDLPPYKILG